MPANKLNGYYAPPAEQNTLPAPPLLQQYRDDLHTNPQFSGEMQSWTPSLSDRAAYWLSQNVFGDTREGVQAGKTTVNALNMTPAGAATGAYDVGRNAAEGNALGAAGSALAIFGGPMAKTANLVKLNTAKMLAKRGASAEDIWNATGWMKGVGDKWQFEIPDTEAAPNYTGKAVTQLSGALQHPELYAAYPEMAEVPVGLSGEQGNSLGYYQPPMEGSPAVIGFSPKVAKDPRAFVSTALHEAQHGVQYIENFPRGASGSMLRPNTPAWDIYSEIRRTMTTPVTLAEYTKQTGFGSETEAQSHYELYASNLERMQKHGIPDWLDKEAQETAVQEAYLRSAGEVQARNVQDRWAWASPSEYPLIHRPPGTEVMAPMIKKPWQQDIPVEDQIVEFFRK